MKKFSIKRILSVLCALSVLLSTFALSADSAFAKSKVNKYPAPTKLKTVTYSEKTAKIEWALSKKLKKNSGFQVLYYNPKTGKYTSIGHTTKKNYIIKNLPETETRRFAVRTYVKKKKKYYYGKFTAINIPMPVKSVKLKSAKYASKGKANISWEKNDTADGYIFQYSTSNIFYKSYTSTLIFYGKDTVSTVLKGLGKAKYYFRITPFKVYDKIRYAGKWSGVLTAEIKTGCTFAEMLNACPTDVSGKDTIYSLTKKGVDISKYKDTYTRFKAIYDWHMANARSFASCYYCTISFNKCVDALFGKTKQYDDFIKMADGHFQNRSGSRPIHKWPVIFLAGIPYITDPRIDSYIDESCFGLPKGNATEKRFLFSKYFSGVRTKDIFAAKFAVEYKVL